MCRKCVCNNIRLCTFCVQFWLVWSLKTQTYKPILCYTPTHKMDIHKKRIWKFHCAVYWNQDTFTELGWSEHDRRSFPIRSRSWPILLEIMNKDHIPYIWQLHDHKWLWSYWSYFHWFLKSLKLAHKFHSLWLNFFTFSCQYAIFWRRFQTR